MMLVISSTFLLARPKVPSCATLVAVSRTCRTRRWFRSEFRGEVCVRTYPLLRQTAGALVLGVAEQLNNALLVGGKTENYQSVQFDILLHRGSHRRSLPARSDVLGPLRGDCADSTYPATSRVISRTKAVRLERKPLRREIFWAGCLGVTSVVRLECGSMGAWSLRRFKRTVAGVGANDEACDSVSIRNIAILRAHLLTGALLHFLRHGWLVCRRRPS